MFYSTICKIKEANARAGFHFFKPDAMRFFRSRVLDTVYGGRYLITSERYVSGRMPNEPRLFTVRQCDDKGNVTTVGVFQEHATKAQAVAAIKRLLKSEVEGAVA